VNVLAVVHGPLVRAGIFADVIEAKGHRFLEWRVPEGGSPPDADAVIVFGGSMHVDQEQDHPWLRAEEDYIDRLLTAKKPLLGVCLGAQLLAKVLGARVGPAREPEVGWFGVALTPAGVDDPVLGRLPPRFDAFQWHRYAFDVPPDAVELARNDACSQAFRVGERAWGVQFHPEVALDQILGWADEKDEVPGQWGDFVAEAQARIGDWNSLGRTLAAAFLDVASSDGQPTP
jgi:GMP synthase-like glutamine amidotransferase